MHPREHGILYMSRATVLVVTTTRTFLVAIHLAATVILLN